MNTRIICVNAKASFNYFIEDKFEFGIVLAGTEVKSIRTRGASIVESYVQHIGTELFLYNAYIARYQNAFVFNHDPRQMRKILCKKKEAEKLIGLVKRGGYALVPISLYFKKNLVKVSVALARGKKLYDKRRTIKEKDWNRSKSRILET